MDEWNCLSDLTKFVKFPRERYRMRQVLPRPSSLLQPYYLTLKIYLHLNYLRIGDKLLYVFEQGKGINGNYYANRHVAISATSPHLNICYHELLAISNCRKACNDMPNTK